MYDPDTSLQLGNAKGDKEFDHLFDVFETSSPVASQNSKVSATDAQPLVNFQYADAQTSPKSPARLSASDNLFYDNVHFDSAGIQLSPEAEYIASSPPVSGSDKENHFRGPSAYDGKPISAPSCGDPPVPSSANDCKLHPLDQALCTSNSTIPDPDHPSAWVDFNYQEPAFEYAAEPVLPSSLPGANLRQAPNWTPIINRRVQDCVQGHKPATLNAYSSIEKLRASLSQYSRHTTSSTTSKKRSADECRTPRSGSTNKRAKKDICDTLIQHIDEQIALNQQVNSPQAPSYSPITENGSYDPTKDGFPAPLSSPIYPPMSVLRGLPKTPNNTPAANANDITQQRSPIRPSISPITPDDELNRLLPPGYIPTGATFKAYPGQFTALTHDFLARQGQNPKPFTFPEAGCNLNANGTYTNTSLIETRPSYRLDYSARFKAGKWRKITKHEEDMYATLESKMLAAAGSGFAKQRTESFATMRARIHHEASQARILGVSAGEYRYYDGHLTIEECVEGGVCVCWERCACSAVCTRFPDMLCPCSDNITMDEN